mmetsp:Transcript_9703/g.30112  ORF Transcript_9703/g.30112 Transcript_9703/m.30112 type:complete len:256 (+) Transcript_9703:169-936(+)
MCIDAWRPHASRRRCSSGHLRADAAERAEAVAVRHEREVPAVAEQPVPHVLGLDAPVAVVEEDGGVRPREVARGIDALAAAGQLRVPDVVALGAVHEDDVPARGLDVRRHLRVQELPQHRLISNAGARFVHLARVRHHRRGVLHALRLEVDPILVFLQETRVPVRVRVKPEGRVVAGAEDQEVGRAELLADAPQGLEAQLLVLPRLAQALPLLLPGLGQLAAQEGQQHLLRVRPRSRPGPELPQAPGGRPQRSRG